MLYPFFLKYILYILLQNLKSLKFLRLELKFFIYTILKHFNSTYFRFRFYKIVNAKLFATYRI